MMKELSPHERQIVDQAVGILEARMLHPGAMLSTLSVISSYLMLKLSDYEQQVFGCIFLDSKQRIVEDAVLFKGTLNICPAYPRVIVQEALKRPAVNVIVYRNDLEWEMDAYSIPLNIGPEARKVHAALGLIDVKLMDYIVVSGTHTRSLEALGVF